MKSRFRLSILAAVVAMVAFQAHALTPHTSTAAFTAESGTADWDAFEWEWASQTEQMDVSFSDPVTSGNVLIRMYREVYGDIALEAGPFAVDGTGTNATLTISSTNIPTWALYYADIMQVEESDPVQYKSLGRGTIKRSWNAWDTTNFVGDTTSVQLVYTYGTNDTVLWNAAYDWVNAYSNLTPTYAWVQSYVTTSAVAIAVSNLTYYTPTGADTNYATAAQGATADAALPKAGGAMTGAITGLTDLSGTGRRVFGTGLNVADIDAASVGASQSGFAQGGTRAIGNGAYGASQSGYNYGDGSVMEIGNSAHGASQRGQVAIGSTATNNAIGAIQLLKLEAGQNAFTTSDATASLLLGAGTATHKQSITIGDGNSSAGEGWFSGEGIQVDTATITSNLTVTGSITGANLSNTNTGDQDLTAYVTTNETRDVTFSATSDVDHEGKLTAKNIFGGMAFDSYELKLYYDDGGSGAASLDWGNRKLLGDWTTTGNHTVSNNLTVSGSITGATDYVASNGASLTNAAALADAALPKAGGTMTGAITGLTDLSGTGRRVFGTGLNVTNIDETAVGASQSGFNAGTQTIGEYARGASQRGYNSGTQTIGNSADGASQNGENYGTQTIGSDAYGASQRGYNSGTQTIGQLAHGAGQNGVNSGTQTIGEFARGASQSGFNDGTQTIGEFAYGASQRGYVAETATATNNAVGAIQLLNLQAGQNALTTVEATASILLGAGVASNKNSITIGDGNTSAGEGWFSGEGIQVDTATITSNLTVTGSITGANLSNTNTGDQDLTAYVTTNDSRTVALTGALSAGSVTASGTGTFGDRVSIVTPSIGDASLYVKHQSVLASRKVAEFESNNGLLARLMASGYFGFGGITDPADIIHVNGNIRIGNSGGDGFARLFIDNAPYSTIPMTAFNAVSRDSDSRSEVHIGGGTAAGYAATQLRFYTGTNRTHTTGIERLRIDENGNVGIGDTTPDYLLDVAGTLGVDGAATFGSTVTAASYALTNNRLAIPAATQIGTNATYAISYADGAYQVFGFSSTNDLTLTLTGPGAGYRSQHEAYWESGYTNRAVTWTNTTGALTWINDEPTTSEAQIMFIWTGTNAAAINTTVTQ